MRRYTPLLCSFVLGAVCMSLVNPHTSTVTQRAFALAQTTPSVPQNPPTPQSPPATTPPPMLEYPLHPEFGSAFFATQGAKPLTPKVAWLHFRGTMDGGQQQLDGLDCDGCTLKNVVLTYAGGPFRIANGKLSVRGLYLDQGSPADNTLKVLFLAGAIPSRMPPKKQIIPNAPPVMKTNMPTLQRVDWDSSK
jgi:hypothetical protein